MLFRYNPLKRQLHFYDMENNRIIAFDLDLLAAVGWRNCDHENLKRLPISTK